MADEQILEGENVEGKWGGERRPSRSGRELSREGGGQRAANM